MAFWSVAEIRSVKGMLRSSAIYSATCLTKAGSFRSPLCGTGDRYGQSVSKKNEFSGIFFATSLTFVAFL